MKNNPAAAHTIDFFTTLPLSALAVSGLVSHNRIVIIDCSIVVVFEKELVCADKTLQDACYDAKEGKTVRHSYLSAHHQAIALRRNRLIAHVYQRESHHLIIHRLHLLVRQVR